MTKLPNHITFFTCLMLLALHIYAEETTHMFPNTIENSAILEKIECVENGLIPAICVESEPILKKNLHEQMKKLKVPAVGIAVINNGKIEWAKAYGMLSATDKDKANIETLFQAGSVSKPVAALAALALVQKGLIDLDADVNQKLTSWKIPDNEYTSLQKVTLRTLLSHSSGLNVIGFDGYLQHEQIPSITQTLDGIKPANNPPVRVEFAPSSKMSYSGGGYNVVQQIVEDITKMPFHQFMQTTVLNPTGMNKSTFEYLPRDFVNVASAHPSNAIPMEGKWKTYPESAAAGLWTTPIDLAKYLIAIQNGLTSEDGSILNKHLLEIMVTPQVAVHGLGPVVNGSGEELEVSHKGRTDGFTCGFVSFPYLKQGAVVMINAGNEAGFVDDLLRGIASVYNWPSYAVKVKTTIKLPNAILDKYAGRYGFSDAMNDIYDLFIFREGEELFCKIGSTANSNKLYAETENQFFLLDTGYDVVFKETNGVVTKLTIIVQPGFERDFKKF